MDLKKKKVCILYSTFTVPVTQYPKRFTLYITFTHSHTHSRTPRHALQAGIELATLQLRDGHSTHWVYVSLISIKWCIKFPNSMYISFQKVQSPVWRRIKMCIWIYTQFNRWGLPNCINGAHLGIYIYIYIYACICICIYTHIHAHILMQIKMSLNNKPCHLLLDT